MFLIPLTFAQVFNNTINLTTAIHLIDAVNNTVPDGNYGTLTDITTPLSDGFFNVSFITDLNPSDNVSLFIRFEEGSGTNAEDISGNELNGTLRDGALFVGSKGFNNTGDFSVKFDGTNDWVQILDDPLIDFGTEDFSYAFWFNTSNAGQRQGLLSKRVTGAGGGFAGYFAFIFEGGDVVRAGLEGTSGGVVSVDSLTNVSDSQWHHLAVTHNRAGNIIIYIDGVNEAETSIVTVNGAMDNTLDIILGANNGIPPARIDFLEGNIDEVNMWNFTKTPEEILTIFENGLNFDITAIKLNFSTTLNTNNNYFLRLTEASMFNASVTVHRYINDSDINTTNSTTQILMGGTGDININGIILDGANAIFRFFTNNLRLFSEIQLIEEVTDVIPPSIINCQVNNTALTCDDFIRFSCNVTDDVEVADVFFGFDDSDGKNFEQASIDTGDIFIFDKQYTETTSGSNRTYNFTNATATDIANNINITFVNISYNYSCSAPDTTPPVIITDVINNSIIDLRVSNQTVNFTVTDDLGIKNITFIIFNESETLFSLDIFLNASETSFTLNETVDISGFASGFYFINRIAFDTSDNKAVLLHRFSVIDFDLAITLIFPTNNSIVEFFDTPSELFNIDFQFNVVTDVVCNLFLNDTFEQTKSATSGDNQFSVNGFNVNQTLKYNVGCDFTGTPLNSSFHIFEIQVTKVTQHFEIGVCKTDTGSVLLFSLFILISFTLIIIGMGSRIGFIGVFGSIMLFVLSWHISPCIAVFGTALLLLSVLLFFFFIFNSFFPSTFGRLKGN